MSLENMESTSEQEPDTSFAGNMAITSPQSNVFSGSNIASAFDKMSSVFNKMSAAAKVSVMTDTKISGLEKIALIKCSNLTLDVKRDLVKFAYSKLSAAQKKALFGSTMGAVTGGKALAKKDNIKKSLGKATDSASFKRQYGDKGRHVASKKV